MYVAPRPILQDDPWFAVRLAAASALAFLAIPMLNPALPPFVAAFPVALIAAHRKAYDPIKLMAGPIATIVLAIVMTWVVEILRPMPFVYIGVMWLIFFVGFREILRTGATVGMLLIFVSLLISIMGMHGSATVATMRDTFILSALVALGLAPVVYFIFPARTKEKLVEDLTPTVGDINTGAAIRATVLMALSFWLYAVMQPSDMMMAMIAAMVIVFPTRVRVWVEARERIDATLYGAGAAAIVLLLVTVSFHLFVIVALVFLTALCFGSKMLSGAKPSTLYQYALSVALALIAGAVTTQDPAYASYTRIALTVAGAFSAALAVALLDALTGWAHQELRADQHA